KALAGFFNHVIKGKVPEQFQTFLCQTYLVALEKDPDDKTKLRPLGVPSSIHQHLLPFNYAIRVSCGVDIIVKTVQLAVDKYIIKKEQNGELPTRALVSLDIKNMFNAVSRERLREIIAEHFPTLKPFADLIYDRKGKTFVQKEDGSWVIIEVNKGFSQGCPASPAFAAIILHDILSKIQPELECRAAHRALNNDKGDDSLGSLDSSWDMLMMSTVCFIMMMFNFSYSALRHLLYTPWCHPEHRKNSHHDYHHWQISHPTTEARCSNETIDGSYCPRRCHCHLLHHQK
ncbi:hypothetical protein ACHAXN_002323, partial [Cyclotella atomus]